MSLSKNISNNLPEKGSALNQGQLSLQTPNKVNRISNLLYSQNKTQNSVTNLLSSGKLKKNIFQYNNNLFCPTYSCNSADCNCYSIDTSLQSFIFSPSTNFLFHSPDSFEKYMNSTATERINVLKLKNRNETRAVIQIDQVKEDISVNKENSNVLSNCNSNNITPRCNKNLTSGSKKSWKSSTSKINSERKSIFSKEHNNTKKNLLNEFERNHVKFFEMSNHKEYDDEVELKKDISLNEDLELNKKTQRLRTYSFKEILDSPLCTEKKCSTTEKKRKIFECSDYKIRNFTNSLTSSDYKSIVYDPTLFSTQKKDKKRHRKNSYQMTILQDEYKLTKCKDWSKEKITEISMKTGLSENKVYKWLWDQKNKNMFENKRFLIRNGN